MCLSIPSKVIKIDKEENSAVVDTMGVKREVSLDLMDQSIEEGDFLLIHVGYAMNKIDEDDALESLKLYEEIIQKMEENETKL